MYIPLKVTTDYSLLKSLIKVSDLIKYLKNNNVLACAIVDNNLFGVQEFYDGCLYNNIKPIIGLEIYYNKYTIYLYAKNYNGYKNLLKINTIKQREEIKEEDLLTYKEDLVCVIDYQNLNILDSIKEIYEDIYLGFKDDYEYDKVSVLSDKIVYVRDIKCFKESDLVYLNYLEMINNGNTINEYEFNSYHDNYYIDSVKEEYARTTIMFSERLNVVIPKNNRYLPKYCDDSLTYLTNLCIKGLNKRFNNQVNSEYSKRLLYELDVIKKMGFVDYFLIVYDYVLFSKKNNILVGPGRGSAAGSLVSYSLGITNIDPIKYDLLFERFLNEHRITMPDIDIDFDSERRDEVIDYLKNKYGILKCMPIITYSTLSSKMILRDVSRVLSIDNDVVNKFISLIDADLSLKDNYEKDKVKKIISNYKQLVDVYKIAMKLEGLKRQTGTHAAGIVISSEELDNVIPLCVIDGVYTTGYTMNYLEELGLIKMDILALKNLTTISDTLKLINDPSLNMNEIDLNDKEVYELFACAKTDGIFQFEKKGMQDFLRKLQPTSFSDLVVALALYRPGPMDNIDTFIKRKKGIEKVNYLHEDLEPILKETYGIIVYQEQILKILVNMGGYTLSEADLVRRAISKKKLEVLEQEKEKFVNSAIKKGYSKEVSTKVFDFILKFANYGFNKSHSVSYAYLAYQMAYLRVHYSLYFITSLLNSSLSNLEKTSLYLGIAKSNNLVLIKPDINLSGTKYYINNNTLIIPLTIIKNIGNSIVSNIIKDRNEFGLYKDYLDFVNRVSKYNINKKIIEMLIKADALKEFNINKRTLIENIDLALNYASLLNDLDESLVERPILDKYSEYSELELREMEIDSYGFYISNHPAIKAKDVVKLVNISDYYSKYIIVYVLIERIKIIKTKKNEDMAFISASDETGSLDFTIFPNRMHLIDNFVKNKCLYIKGNVEKRMDKYQIIVSDIKKE